MQKAQVYVVKTPAGNYKAYALGYADDYNGDPDNNQHYYRPLPDQPLRGFGNPLEVSGYIQNRFASKQIFDHWSIKEAGDGNVLNKNMEGWQIFDWSNPSAIQQNDNISSDPKTKVTKMPRRKKMEVQEEEIEQEDDQDECEDDDEIEEELEPEPKPQKRRKKRTRKQNKNNSFDSQMSQLAPNTPMQQNFFSNLPQQNKLSYDQYKQIADGVLQVFENTLMIAASYNMAINSVTLAHAYRAIKLIGAMQFYPAFDAIRIASTHDNMWTSLRDAIIQANRTVGINI